ncbi:MAG: hypothetical protein M3347_14400, partial [Armatimonadota bacterium]|nr:hypothetical protein [Armatimonadota bacterium]
MLRHQFSALLRVFALRKRQRNPKVILGIGETIFCGELAPQENFFEELRNSITHPQHVATLIEIESAENPEELPYTAVINSDDFMEDND